MATLIEVLNVPCNTIVFLIKDGKIYQAKYLGFDMTDNEYGHGWNSKRLFSLGKLGTLHIDTVNAYRTVDDAIHKINRIPMREMDDQSFTQMFLANSVLSFKGRDVGGYLMSVYLTPTWYKADVHELSIRDDKLDKFFGWHGRKIDTKKEIDKFFKTADECSMKYVPEVIMLDEEYL